MTESSNNHIEGNKFCFGEKEFTNLIWVLIRAYRYHNKNQDPESIVMPDVRLVNGVKIEWPEVIVEKPKRTSSKTGN